MRGLYINLALLLSFVAWCVPRTVHAQTFPPPPSFSPTFEITYAWNGEPVTRGGVYAFPEDGVGEGTYGWPGGLALGSLYKGELNNASEINGHLMGNASTMSSTQPNDYFLGSGKYFVTILRVSQHAIFNDPLHLYNEWFLHGTTQNPDARPPAEWGILEFVVRDGVPLYTQIESGFPSQALTSEWDDDVYSAGEPGVYGCGGQQVPDVAACGCAITSAVMVSRFHNATDGIDGNKIDPGTLTAWLKENNGYLEGGSVNWNSIAKYTGNKIKFTTHNSVVNNFPLLDEKLNQNLPVIARAEYGRGDRSAHFFVIDKKLASSYRVKDPYWYNTKTLDEPATNHTAKVRDYLGGFDGLRVYEPHDGSPYAYVTFALGSPAELLITDAAGRRLGKDGAGALYNEIPGASYGSDDFGNPEEYGVPPEHEGKVAYIPNPEGEYSISVVGTGNGPYSLTSVVGDSHDNTHETKIVGAILEAQMVAYRAVVDPDNATTLVVAPTDDTPPETAATLEGIEGEAGWFRSDVIVTLSAMDESGVERTEYSRDGTTWMLSAEPLTETEEGEHMIWYRSIDTAGNTEEPKSVQFAIDRTAPEARVLVTPETKQVRAYALDQNKSAQGITETVNGNKTTYIISDKAGNETRVVVGATTKPAFLRAFRIDSIQYNNEIPITPPENIAAYAWVFKRAILQSLVEDVFIKQAVNVTGVYAAKTNTTQLVTIDLATKKKAAEKKTGPILIGIETNKGGIRPFTQ